MGFFDDVNNAWEDAKHTVVGGDGKKGLGISDIVNYAAQFYTGGIASFQNGRIGKNGYTMEGIGEINGRNDAREAMNQAAHRAELEAAARDQDMLNQRNMAMNNDISASNQIAGIRNSAAAKANPGLRFNSLGQNADTRDFLGL